MKDAVKTILLAGLASREAAIASIEKMVADGKLPEVKPAEITDAYWKRITGNKDNEYKTPCSVLLTDLREKRDYALVILGTADDKTMDAVAGRLDVITAAPSRGKSVFVKPAEGELVGEYMARTDYSVSMKDLNKRGWDKKADGKGNFVLYCTAPAEAAEGAASEADIAALAAAEAVVKGGKKSR